MKSRWARVELHAPHKDGVLSLYGELRPAPDDDLRLDAVRVRLTAEQVVRLREWLARVEVA